MNPVSMATLNLPAPDPRDTSGASVADVFARVLVKELRSALPEGGWLGGGPFESFETLLDEQLALALAPSLERSGLHPSPRSHRPAAVVEGRLSSGFGMRRDPIDSTHRHHDGVDLAAERGAPIRAARAGRVVRAERVAGYGKLVVVDHGAGLETRYAHCDSIEVAVGDRVAAGAQLGRVGATGRATGPHLHFEVRSHGRPVDPVAAGFVARP